MRAFNRVLSLLVGAALLAGGLFILVEVVTGAITHRPWPVRVDRWADALRAHSFADASAKITFTVTALLGLVLLIAEARPWPKRSIALPGADGEGRRSWLLNRRSVERQTGRAIRSATTATAAKVRLRARRATWRLRVAATASPEARPEIERQAQLAVARLGGPDHTPVRVRIAKTRRVD